MKNQPACPECERLASVSKESQELGEFLDWIFRRKNSRYAICKIDPESGKYYPTHLGDYQISQILADYYQIDLDKVEQERTALLNWIREENES